MQALRPEFTESLAARLATGACLNLVGPHGQGRRRTLADLRERLPVSMPVLQANLRHYPHDLAAMLADLRAQAGLGTTDSLAALSDGLGRSIIILHNLDEIRPGKDSGYDGAFFAQLHGWRDRPGPSLLCVTTSAKASPLQLETLALPPLTGDEILAELGRRWPGVEAARRPLLARWIAAQARPYSLMEQPERWPDQG